MITESEHEYVYSTVITTHKFSLADTRNEYFAHSHNLHMLMHLQTYTTCTPTWHSAPTAYAIRADLAWWTCSGADPA